MIYLAETRPDSFKVAHQALLERGLPTRYLLSYHYFKRKDMDALVADLFAGGKPDLFLDSGAWSAFTSGVPLDLPAYIEFIRRFGHHFTVYSNLDDMRNPQATWDNQRTMEDAGLAPLPAFHVGETWDWLEKYAAAYPYIAVGGMVPHRTRRRALTPWIAKVFRIAGHRRIHGFGATGWEMSLATPWYSADSSSWSSGIRWGEISIWTGRKFEEIHLGDPAKCGKWAKAIRSMGFDFRDYADRRRNTHAANTALSAVSFALSSNYLQRNHEEATRVRDL
jgi:hypothetical protein